MKSVVLTGASKGIGEACVARLVRSGWRVFAGYRAPEDGARLRDFGAHVIPVRLDVTASADIATLAVTVAEHTGAAGLDAVVNNAGISVAGPLEFLPVAALRAQLEVNVVGQVAVTQALLPALRRARGRIIFIGSISGRSALPFVGAYAASKFALEAITDSLRVELHPFGLHVSIIEPGAIATPIWERSLALGERNLEGAPPELQAYYGRLLDRLRARIGRGVHGLPADAVARVVESALTEDPPRSRYLVGNDARARALMQRVLPDRVRDAVVRRRLERM